MQHSASSEQCCVIRLKVPESDLNVPTTTTNKWKLCEMKDVSTNFIVVNTLQCIHVLNLKNEKFSKQTRREMRARKQQ